MVHILRDGRDVAVSSMHHLWKHKGRSRGRGMDLRRTRTPSNVRHRSGRLNATNRCRGGTMSPARAPRLLVAPRGPRSSKARSPRRRHEATLRVPSRCSGRTGWGSVANSPGRQRHAPHVARPRGSGRRRPRAPRAPGRGGSLLRHQCCRCPADSVQRRDCRSGGVARIQEIALLVRVPDQRERLVKRERIAPCLRTPWRPVPVRPGRRRWSSGGSQPRAGGCGCKGRQRTRSLSRSSRARRLVGADETPGWAALWSAVDRCLQTRQPPRGAPRVARPPQSRSEPAATTR